MKIRSGLKLRHISTASPVVHEAQIDVDILDHFRKDQLVRAVVLGGQDAHLAQRGILRNHVAGITRLEGPHADHGGIHRCHVA